MSVAPSPAARPPLALGVLLALAALKLAIHAAALTRYGWFRDELYYVVCSWHPALGYVDHPPLSIWLLGAWRAAFGDSLAVLRLLPALAGAGVVVAAGALAREVGGGRFAQALAALAVIAAPIFLGSQHVYSMNALDQLAWPLASLALLRALDGRSRGWLALGAALGLGLLNKISVLWFGAGLAAGLLLTAERRRLATPGPWTAAGIALAIFAPHVLWQVTAGWPTVEFIRNATAHKMAAVSAPAFLLEQVLTMNPVLLPLWLAGLAACLARLAGAGGRVLGIAWLVVAAILLAAGTSRASYLAPAYPTLFAAGAMVFERATSGRRGPWLRAAAVAVVIAGGAFLAPLAVPVLPVESFVRWSRDLPLPRRGSERQEMGALPQHFADMHGWNELVDAVSAAFEALPPEERARCVVFGQNYGESSAINVLGRARGLPRAISGHNSYWLWGPGAGERPVVIVIGGDPGDNVRLFESVERVGTWTSAWAMPYQRDVPIYVGRGMRVPISEIWPRVRFYI